MQAAPFGCLFSVYLPRKQKFLLQGVKYKDIQVISGEFEKKLVLIVILRYKFMTVTDRYCCC